MFCLYFCLFVQFICRSRWRRGDDSLTVCILERSVEEPGETDECGPATSPVPMASQAATRSQMLQRNRSLGTGHGETDSQINQSRQRSTSNPWFLRGLWTEFEFTLCSSDAKVALNRSTTDSADWTTGRCWKLQNSSHSAANMKQGFDPSLCINLIPASSIDDRVNEYTDTHKALWWGLKIWWRYSTF